MVQAPPFLTRTSIDLTRRPRRNRQSAAIRALAQETHLHPSDFIAPLFIIEGENKRQPIESMPGVERLTIDLIVKEVEELYLLGVRAVDLFPVIPQEKKDASGSEALAQGNLLQQTVVAIKQAVPEMCVMVDVALDPYTNHGHDGLVGENGQILNDPTLDVLAKMSVFAAEAGADIIAPSDMMDGRCLFIRQELDRAGFSNVGILSYAAKYASAFYGPFRDALHSAPKFGDKKSYQMNPANWREALLEAAIDEEEGADFLLIKPGLAYLDIVARLREQTALPIGAYHVSGEYAMVKAAAERGWINGDLVMEECLMAFKRAGCDFIFTYAAKWMAKRLQP